MNKPLRVLTGAAILLGIAACGHTNTAVQSSPASSSSGTPETSSAAPATSATLHDSPIKCPVQDGNQIKIYVGDVDCQDAYALARRYDLNGPKSQQIDSWTCVGRNPDTQPLLFSCDSDTGVEFAVYPAS